MTAKRERNFSWLKWVIIGILFIGLVVVALVLNSDSSVEDATKIEGAIDIDNGDLEINWDRYPTKDIELSEDLVISEPGTYHLTGSLDDGSITVNAKNTYVRLILDNVFIKNSSGPAIVCNDGEDLVIEFIGDNTLEDGSEYSPKYDEDITGVIYSKADLTFNGSGNLSINSNYQDAIVGKDDLKINGGNYIIEAKDDAIRGKDSVYIVDGNLDIISGADGIKSTNDIEPRKGFVMIEKGNIAIKASAKGVKATHSLLIYSGDIYIDSYDDAIHSDNYVGIVDGKIEISAGDDGIHANRELIIDGGTLSIVKAYEGIESQVVTINGGNTTIKSFDDGINAGGGADESANNRPGAGTFNTDENCILSINGGELYINSAGDGVDSNGYLYFTGGKTIIDGPTNNGNGALDAGLGISMNGGEVIALGSSGMAESLGISSSVYNASIYLSEEQKAGTVITVKDASNNTIIEHTSAKTFNHIAVGSEELQLAGTYTIYIDGEEYEQFTITEVVTTIGNVYMNQQMPPKPVEPGQKP